MSIEHEYTAEIVCPYCGYVFSDSWEVDSGEEDMGEIDCGRCEQAMIAYRNVSVTYSTRKMEDKK